MAARFWVGGTGNFSDNTNHWAATSNGSPGASKPGSADTATWDGSSGGGTCTFDEAVDVTSITSSAHTGTIDTNGQTVTTQTWTNTGTATRTVTFGSSTINITGTGTVVSMATTTNLTLNATSSTVNVTGAGIIFRVGDSAGGGKVWGTVNFTGSGNVTFNTGSITFGTLTRTATAVKTDILTINNTTTITAALNLNGNSVTNRLLVRSDALGTARTFTTTGATVTSDNADYRDITLSVAKDLSAGSVGDCGGNTNITFTTAASQGLTMSTSKSWSDATIWTSRVPLPQDDVTVTSWTGGLLTGDMPRLGKSIDFTGAAGTGFSWSSGITIYGSLTLDAGMGTISNGATGALLFEGRSSFTLTTAGKNLQTGGVTLGFDMVGGTMTLMDALSSTGAFARLTQGTFDADTYNVTVSTWTTSSGTTTDLGTGTWTFAGSTSPIWSMNASANVTAGSSTIALTNTSSSNYTFAGGGKTYNDLTITGGGTGIRTFSGSNTFNTFTIGGPKTVTFTAGTTQTITDFVRSVGTDVITLQSSSAGSAATIAKTSAIKEQLDYLTITDVNVTPASTWYYGFNSTYNSGTGWNAGAGVSNLMLLGVG